MKIKSLCLFVASLLLLFIGCNKEEEIAQLPEVNCQSVVKSTITDNQITYAVIKQIFIFGQIREVYEFGPDGFFDLSDYVISQYTYTKVKTVKEYYESEPQEGTYLFNIIFPDGREKIISSNITKPYLIPAKNIDFTINEGLVKVTWDIVDNADYYRVGLMNATKPVEIYLNSNNKYEAWIDLTDYGFTLGDQINTSIEIVAIDTKGNSELINSESSAQIEIHIDDFQPWWVYW